MEKIKCEIIRQIGVLSEAPSGWKCELNIVKWGDNQPTYDLRDWSADHSRWSKGKTLSKQELEQLYKAIKLEVCRKEIASQSNLFGSSSDC